MIKTNTYFLFLDMSDNYSLFITRFGIKFITKPMIDWTTLNYEQR